MAKKSFFKERTAKEIRELKSSRAYNQRGLVERIDSLPKDRALEVRVQIIPGRFFAMPGVKTGKDASRKALKKGDLLRIPHPETREGCYRCPEIPLAMRKRAFEGLAKLREEEINFVGYSMQPTWGDRTRRVFPFVWLPEGAKLFAYSETYGMRINPEIYDDAREVKHEGADVVVEVPSRTKKNPRYKFRLLHVPIIRSEENLATVMLLKPAVFQDEETREPVVGRTPHEIYLANYGYEGERKDSKAITFYPHDDAGYLAIARDEWYKHNMTPMEMNPFALPSQRQADFYTKLCSNVLIYDSTLESKDKLRNLHLAEKSILLARAIGKFGHDDFSFWDPARDGKLKDYDWGAE